VPPRFRRACDVACHKAGSVMEGHLDDVALSKSMTAFANRCDSESIDSRVTMDFVCKKTDIARYISAFQLALMAK
jgi:hypothetical protein